MKTSLLLILAISAVSGTPLSSGDQTLYGGDAATTSNGGSEVASGYPATSSSGSGAAPSSSSSSSSSSSYPASSGGEINDDQLIADIMGQINHSDGLPADLISSLISGTDDDMDDDVMTQIRQLVGTDDGKDDNGHAQTIGQASTDSYGTGSPTSAAGVDVDDSDDDDDDDDNSTIDITNFVLSQLGVAKQIFENAKTQLSEAESAAEMAPNPIAPSTKLAAQSIITNAKSEARTSILQARKNYVNAIDMAKRDVSVMKIVEKRFRSLACAFSQARGFAGKAIITLKGITSNGGDSDDNDDDNGRRGFDDDDSNKMPYSSGYGYKSRNSFLVAVSAAKSRISHMKETEKRFLAITRAMAKIRALAYTKVRQIRKHAIGLAKVMSVSEVAVKAAVDTAKMFISQAISTSRATSYAKAQVSSKVAKIAAVQAQLAVKLASNALTAAKSHAGISESDENDIDDNGGYGNIGSDSVVGFGDNGSNQGYDTNASPYATNSGASAADTTKTY